MNWFRCKIDEHKVRRFVIKTRLVINAHLTGPCFMFFYFFFLTPIYPDSWKSLYSPKKLRILRFWFRFLFKKHGSNYILDSLCFSWRYFLNYLWKWLKFSTHEVLICQFVQREPDNFGIGRGLSDSSYVFK